MLGKVNCHSESEPITSSRLERTPVQDSPKARSLLRILLALPLLGTSVSCAPDPAPVRESHSLIALAADARVTTPTQSIGFLDSESAPLLVSGWIRRGDKVYTETETGVLEFYVGASEARTVDLRAHRSAKGGPSISVAIQSNGQDVTTLKIGPVESYSFEIPAAATRPGWNRLTFTPSLPERARRRPLVEWERLEFSPSAIDAGEPLRVDSAGESLIVAAGHRVDFLLDLPSGSAVAIDGVRFLGEGCEPLSIDWQPLGEQAVELLDLSGPDEVSGEMPAVGGLGTLGLTLPGVTVDSCKAAAIRRPRIEAPIVAAVEPLDPPETRRAANVVFFLVDTLRADHLSTYGYTKPTAPELDRFAEDATLFLDSQAQSSWTRASVASIFTGLSPQEHGANEDDEGLATEAVTVAEIMRKGGFQTAGFTANGNAAQGAGFRQGFQTWKHLGRSRSETLLDEALDWLRDRDEDKPFFLWIHTVDPHAPYEPPADLIDAFAPPNTDLSLGQLETFQRFHRGELDLTSEVMDQLVGLYDAEIRSNDRTFGRLLDELETQGLTDDTIVVFLSDHGEEFGEHGGWTHGKTLHAEMLETPLVIRFPDVARGERVDFTAQHIDLLPTVVEYFGLDVQTPLSGRSLLPILAGTVEPPRQAHAYLRLRGRRLSSVIAGDWKYVAYDPTQSLLVPNALLYNRAKDSGEAENLLDADMATARALSIALAAAERDSRALLDPKFVDITEKNLERELRALGYVD